MVGGYLYIIRFQDFSMTEETQRQNANQTLDLELKMQESDIGTFKKMIAETLACGVIFTSSFVADHYNLIPREYSENIKYPVITGALIYLGHVTGVLRSLVTQKKTRIDFYRNMQREKTK